MKKLMLAENTLPNIDTDIIYPCLASGKLDGIRGCVQDGQLVSRSLKSSLNRHITAMLSTAEFEGLDGELTVQGERWNDFNHNQSVIMEQSAKPKFTFHVFDDISQDMRADARKTRTATIVSLLSAFNHSHFNANGVELKSVKQHLVNTPEELRALYDEYRSNGYEGLIVMSPSGKYKNGRSTLKQQIMLKLKPSSDDEGVLIGVNAVYHNLDAGNTKMQGNLVKGSRAGALVLLWKGRKIFVGPGKMSHALATDVLNNFDKYKGKLVTFTYMELYASGEPRSARFKGFRSKEDLSE